VINQLKNPFDPSFGTLLFPTIKVILKVLSQLPKQLHMMILIE